MPNTFASCLSVALLTVAGTAQSVVLPARAATRPGNGTMQSILHGSSLHPNEARSQVVYDLAQVPAVIASVQSLQVRAASNFGGQNRATQLQLAITMSTSGAAPLAPSAAYAANHGANAVTVFQGAVSLPATTGGAWPAPWQPPILFQRPFVIDRTGATALVVELVVQGSSSQSTWYVDGYERDEGSFSREYASGCVTSEGRVVTAYSFKPWGIVPGGSFRMGFAGYPANQPSLAMNALAFGLQGVGGVWGGQRLPFELASVGLPAGSGCGWAVDVVMTLPMTYLPGPMANLGWLHMPNALPVPNDPTLVNLELVAQALAVDQDAAGAPMLITSDAVRMRVGDGVDVPASIVFHTGDNAQPTGTVRTSQAPAIKLNT